MWFSPENNLKEISNGSNYCRITRLKLVRRIVLKNSLNVTWINDISKQEKWDPVYP